MSNKNASFYIENIPANKHLANKTIEIVYKEYEAVTNTEDNTVEIGKFLEKKRLWHLLFCRIIRLLPSHCTLCP